MPPEQGELQPPQICKQGLDSLPFGKDWAKRSEAPLVL